MKQFLAARPWWANALLAFCAYMTVIYLPFDLFFKPVSDDQEVWFGIPIFGMGCEVARDPPLVCLCLGSLWLLSHEEMDVALGRRLCASNCL